MENRLTNKTVAQDEDFSLHHLRTPLILRCFAQQSLEGRVGCYAAQSAYSLRGLSHKIFFLLLSLNLRPRNRSMACGYFASPCG